ncbi:hypothetical protein ABIA06_002081 [Bradyrhizobium yuanmingense]|uniref:hypothetical protein n=1 Tax=Bradyrhizobium yuanmingense TaxID=108015 RepID=UPI003515E113
MKKMLFITGAKGGPGKTLVSHHCRQAPTRWHHPPAFGASRPQRLLRPKVKRPFRIKNPMAVFRRY